MDGHTGNNITILNESDTFWAIYKEPFVILDQIGETCLIGFDEFAPRIGLISKKVLEPNGASRVVDMKRQYKEIGHFVYEYPEQQSTDELIFANGEYISTKRIVLRPMAFGWVRNDGIEFVCRIDYVPEIKTYFVFQFEMRRHRYAL